MASVVRLRLVIEGGVAYVYRVCDDEPPTLVAFDVLPDGWPVP